MKNVMDIIQQKTNEAIESEKVVSDTQSVNLTEVVRQNFEQWEVLFAKLKLSNTNRYAYLVELLGSEEIGIKTTEPALRKIFSRLRAGRGERVFTLSGKPRTNKHWDSGKSVTHASSSTQGPRYSNSGGVPGRAVQLERRGLVSPSQGVRVATTAAAPVEAIAQQVEGIQSGAFGGVSWTLGVNTATFNGLEIAYFGPPLGVSLERLRVPFSKVVGGRQRGEVVEALRFYVGFMEKIGRAGIREPGLVEEEQLMKYAASGWSDSAVALLQTLQNAL